MKTLDEVIELMETQVGELYGITGVVLYAEDILHYLKEHKNQQDFYSDGIKRTTEMIDKCEKTVAEYLAVNNPPLTWDELKQMEGKPVLVEDSNNRGEWVLLSGTEDEYLYFVYRDCAEYKIYRDEQGIRWQAYRKERK